MDCAWPGRTCPVKQSPTTAKTNRQWGLTCSGLEALLAVLGAETGWPNRLPFTHCLVPTSAREHCQGCCQSVAASSDLCSSYGHSNSLLNTLPAHRIKAQASSGAYRHSASGFLADSGRSWPGKTCQVEQNAACQDGEELDTAKLCPADAASATGCSPRSGTHTALHRQAEWAPALNQSPPAPTLI